MGLQAMSLFLPHVFCKCLVVVHMGIGIYLSTANYCVIKIFSFSFTLARILKFHGIILRDNEVVVSNW
jgi:hypothetical protein